MDEIWKGRGTRDGRGENKKIGGLGVKESEGRKQERKGDKLKNKKKKRKKEW